MNTTAFHNDRDYYRYENNTAKNHNVYCTKCSEKVTVENHISFTVVPDATCKGESEIADVCRYCSYTVGSGVYVPAADHEKTTVTVDATCTEDGYTKTTCKNCDLNEKVTIKATGHSYKNGKCENCGESEPITVVKGDLSGDGKVNAMDTNTAKRILSGSVALTQAQKQAGDVNGDGMFNSVDTNIIARFLLGYISKLG